MAKHCTKRVVPGANNQNRNNGNGTRGRNRGHGQHGGRGGNNNRGHANMVEANQANMVGTNQLSSQMDEMHLTAIVEVNVVGANTKSWWVDAGATSHICANKWMFKTYQKLDHEFCYMGSSSFSKIKGKGSMVLKMTSEKQVTLTDVLHVPEIYKNLISGTMLIEKGFKLVFEGNTFVLSKSGLYVGKRLSRE